MKSIREFARAKRERRKVVVLTAYDCLMARLLADDTDALLVGDSVAMVVHGHSSTVAATIEVMQLHTAAVRRGAPDLLIIADMPFLSVRQGRDLATRAAGDLIQAGANAVKIEGLAGHEEIITHLVGSGIPVMGHLGLTPQSVHQLGGHRVQGRSAAESARLLREARLLEQCGAFALVLECVPARLAREVTIELSIPVIGIGAGPHTDGQVLVTTDLLGLDPTFRPSFARAYARGASVVQRSVRRFSHHVRAGKFPARKETPAP